jgi:ubiquinone/menaquinone biosynthesis C-methylase UbiE
VGAPASDIRNPLFARLYTRVIARRAPHDSNRHTLLSGLSGRVLEVGCATGVNFPFYPPSVTELVAVEPEPYLRAGAEAAAGDAPVPVRLIDGQAEALPLADASFDVVVFSLVLCSVRSQPDALGEAWRVLRPGGELRFYEHVAATGRVPLALEQALDRTFWPHAFGNCHTARDTASAINAAGFRIEQCRRLGLREAEAPFRHILGIARRP